MEFELSEEQKDIQRAAEEFARGEFDPDLALELDQKGIFPETIWKKATRLGFIGIHYPEEVGGQGLSLLESLLITEAFCGRDSWIGSALSLVDLGSDLILKFGSKDQKEKFLPPLIKGEKQMTVAFGESEDEQDLSVLSTIFEKREKGYLVNGVKKYVLNLSRADTFIILCRESGEQWLPLIVEKGQEWIEIHPIEKMGLKMISSGDLKLQNVGVPYENRLGERGQELDLFQYYHRVKSLRFLSQALGLMEGAFERALRYSNQREQFGRRLSQFQVIKHKLAEMQVGIEIARCLIYKAALEVEKEEIHPKALFISQIEVARRMAWIVDEALQIFGGYGYMAEEEIERFYRDAWAIRSQLGTEEEMRDLLSERILGRKNETR